MSVYALKQTREDGTEWIQEFDSLGETVRFQFHNGGVLVKREKLPGQPGLWWVDTFLDENERAVYLNPQLLQDTIDGLNDLAAGRVKPLDWVLDSPDKG